MHKVITIKMRFSGALELCFGILNRYHSEMVCIWAITINFGIDGQLDERKQGKQTNKQTDQRITCLEIRNQNTLYHKNRP